MDGSCEEENALLMPRGQRSEWADCLETIEKQQQLNQGLHNSVSEHV